MSGGAAAGVAGDSQRNVRKQYLNVLIVSCNINDINIDYSFVNHCSFQRHLGHPLEGCYLAWRKEALFGIKDLHGEV